MKAGDSFYKSYLNKLALDVNDVNSNYYIMLNSLGRFNYPPENLDRLIMKCFAKISR